MLASKQSFVSPGIVGLDLLAMAGEVCAVRGIHTAIACWNWRPGQANKQAQHATTELQRILPHAPRSPWPAPRAALAAVHRRPLPRQAVPHAPVHRPRIACLDRAAPRGGNRSAGCVRASKPSLGQQQVPRGPCLRLLKPRPGHTLGLCRTRVPVLDLCRPAIRCAAAQPLIASPSHQQKGPKRAARVARAIQPQAAAQVSWRPRAEKCNPRWPRERPARPAPRRPPPTRADTSPHKSQFPLAARPRAARAAALRRRRAKPGGVGAGHRGFAAAAASSHPLRPLPPPPRGPVPRGGNNQFTL